MSWLEDHYKQKENNKVIMIQIIGSVRQFIEAETQKTDDRRNSKKQTDSTEKRRKCDPNKDEQHLIGMEVREPVKTVKLEIEIRFSIKQFEPSGVYKPNGSKAY